MIRESEISIIDLTLKFGLLVILGVFTGSNSFLMAGSVTLAWDRSPDSTVSSYNVYRSLQSRKGYARLNSVPITNLTFTDTGTESAKTYYYAVTSVDKMGRESAFSNEVAHTTAAIGLGNRSPTAANDSIATNEDVSTTVPVLANDSDPDGDPLSIKGFTQPSQGTVAKVNNSSLRYAPPADFHGTTSFNYTVQDSRGASATGKVTIVIRPVNDPPRVVMKANPPSGRFPLTVQFDASGSLDVDGNIVSYNWSFGDGTSGSGKVIQHTYTAPGRFLASLTIKDDAQTSATDSLQVLVSSGDTSNFMVTPTTALLRKLGLAGFVGVSIVNPSPVPEAYSAALINKEGSSLAQSRSVLGPGSQTLRLTSEFSSAEKSADTLVIRPEQNHARGFFMVGDGAGMLDGLEGKLEQGTLLTIPLVGFDKREIEAGLMLFNPSNSTTAEVLVRIFDSDGRLLGNSPLSLFAQSGRMFRLADLLGRSSYSASYLDVVSNIDVCGLGVFLHPRSLYAVKATTSKGVSELFSPHFFTDPNGGSTFLHLLNLSQKPYTGTLELLDDSGQLIASFPVDVRAKSTDILNLGRLLPWSPTVQGGSVRLRGTGSVLAYLHYATAYMSAQSVAPMVATGRPRSHFLHIAQSDSSGMFTGLAVFNPEPQPSTVTVQAFDGSGRKTGQSSFTLEAGGRKADLLNSPLLFGQNFGQTGGYFTVTSSRPIVSLVLFGDQNVSYLSVIEGSAP